MARELSQATAALRGELEDVREDFSGLCGTLDGRLTSLREAFESLRGSEGRSEPGAGPVVPEAALPPQLEERLALLEQQFKAMSQQLAVTGGLGPSEAPEDEGLRTELLEFRGDSGGTTCLTLLV